MKKYLIIGSALLAVVACNNSRIADEQAREDVVKQRTIDSMAQIRADREHVHSSYHHTSYENNAPSTTTNTEPAKRKGMSNTTKGALIGTGAGIVGGALTGAATSQDRGKGALIGGAVGGAVGSGVGYGVGANKDKKEKDQENSGE